MQYGRRPMITIGSFTFLVCLRIGVTAVSVHRAHLSILLLDFVWLGSGQWLSVHLPYIDRLFFLSCFETEFRLALNPLHSLGCSVNQLALQAFTITLVDQLLVVIFFLSGNRQNELRDQLFCIFNCLCPGPGLTLCAHTSALFLSIF